MALVAACVTCSATSPAFAQTARVRGGGGSSDAAAENARAASRPPRVQDVDKAKTLLHYAVGIGVIALCVGVAVVPGRRDHDE